MSNNSNKLFQSECGVCKQPNENENRMYKFISNWIEYMINIVEYHMT